MPFGDRSAGALRPPFRRVARWYLQSRIALQETIDGIPVLHPRFIVIPRANWFSGFFYFLGIFTTLHRLKRELSGYIVHAHFAYPDGVGAALAAQFLRLPYVVTAHGSDINMHAAEPLPRLQIRWALAGAAGVIAVSGALEQRTRDLLGDRRAEITIIPCAGCDPDVFFPRPRDNLRAMLNLSPNSRVAVFVGQLLSIRAVDVLIEAWSILCYRGEIGGSDCLVLVGDGPRRKALEAQIDAARLSSMVRFAGALPQCEVSTYVGAADVLALPSLSEGMPNVVVGALASGIPAVASRMGGVPELIRDANNGFLVPAANAEALSSALANALSFWWTWTACEILSSI